MKRTIKTTVEKEIEVTFPFYATNELHYFRIDDEGCIIVTSHSLFSSIEFIKEYPESWFDKQPCTEEEFLAAYELAKSELQNRLNKSFQKSDENI